MLCFSPVDHLGDEERFMVFGPFGGAQVVHLKFQVIGRRLLHDVGHVSLPDSSSKFPIFCCVFQSNYPIRILPPFRLGKYREGDWNMLIIIYFLPQPPLVRYETIDFQLGKYSLFFVEIVAI